MTVTQKDIADRTGLSRSTVTKILNADPGFQISKATRAKVLKAARELGYNYSFVKRAITRADRRIEINAQADVAITLADGVLFDTGYATIRDISLGGALLTKIRFTRNLIPLERFYIKLLINDIEALRDLVGECEIARFAGHGNGELYQLGVCFAKLSEFDTGRLRTFIQSV